METLIKREGNAYHFIENGQIVFYGYQSSSFLKFFRSTKLFKNKDHVLIASVKSFPERIYVVGEQEPVKLTWKLLTRKPLIKAVYRADEYTIVLHLGKRSIFKNDTQIGHSAPIKFQFWDTDDIQLTINDNEDLQIIYLLFFAAFCSFQDP